MTPNDVIKNHTPYELQAMFQLVNDARERLLERGPHPKGFFNHMNELICVSVMNGLWKYNTPSLMLAMKLLTSIIDKSVIDDSQSSFEQMNAFIKVVNDHCGDTSIADAINVLDEAQAHIEQAL